MVPAIFELEMGGEATGTVHFFCSDSCRVYFIGGGRVIGRYTCGESILPNDGLVCEFCQSPLRDTPPQEPDSDEADAIDTVHGCPSCERPQQFSGLCTSCVEEMRRTPNDPFWQRLAEEGKL